MLFLLFLICLFYLFIYLLWFTTKNHHIYIRLRVVPHFSSGIVERAKRERAWKSPRRVSPFLAWGDFHARSRFARSTISEEIWGTTRSLHIHVYFYFICKVNWAYYKGLVSFVFSSTWYVFLIHTDTCVTRAEIVQWRDIAPAYQSESREWKNDTIF